jgi:hypothetical protein
MILESHAIKRVRCWRKRLEMGEVEISQEAIVIKQWEPAIGEGDQELEKR